MFKRLGKSVLQNNVFKQTSLKLNAPIQTNVLFIQNRNSSTGRGSQVAMLLTGAGHLDGSDITETVSAMIKLSQGNFTPVFFAPDGDAEEIINHMNKTVESNEIRNMMNEVSRVTRTKTLSLKFLREKNFEGLIIPGGGGVGKILSNLDEEGPEKFKVDEEVSQIIKSFHDAEKPIGVMGNAVYLVANVLGKQNNGPGLTLAASNEADIVKHLTDLGNKTVTRKAHEPYSDKDNSIISVPSTLYRNPSPIEIFFGAKDLITDMLSLNKGNVKDTVNWEFTQWYFLKVREFAKEDWEFIKKEVVQEIEEEKEKKASSSDSNTFELN